MEALLYEKAGAGAVRCRLCGRRCYIAPGSRGVCQVRENIGGTLYTLTYGRAASYGVDPIEKKPLYHFHPGTTAFSISTVGCNFQCTFCCNWELSQQKEALGQELPPEQVVKLAKRHGCSSVSYTYTEPTIFFEYALETSRIARREGLYNTFVTNGYMTPEAIDMISGYLDAATVDFKGSADSAFLKSFCRVPGPEPIYESLREMKRKKIFIEITNLIVPDGGDSREAFMKLVRWIIDELGDETPYHILRFFPTYRYTERSHTPSRLLVELYRMAGEAGLKYVYLGNVSDPKYEATYCPSCKNAVIERLGYSIGPMRLDGRRCAFCGREINIIL